MPPIEQDDTRPAPRHKSVGPATVNPDSSRQGPRGTRVFGVLVATIIGAVVLIGIYMIIWGSTGPGQ